MYVLSMCESVCEYVCVLHYMCTCIKTMKVFKNNVTMIPQVVIVQGLRQ